jgi:hypothetical protein
VADAAGDDEPSVLAADWLEHANRAANMKLAGPLASKLAMVDWSAYGQLRGLRATLKRVLSGGDVDVALAEARAAFSRPKRSQDADSGLERFARYLAEEASLSESWLGDRHRWASEILDRLVRDDPAALAVVAKAGHKAADVKKELRNLLRPGSKASEN